MQVKRKIEPKMVAYLDAKLASNGLAQLAIQEKDARTLFVCAAEACVGIKEKTGNNDGTYVELIQETIGGHDREPYCMAAVQTWLAYAELKCEAISPIYPSEHCMTCWRETDGAQRVKKSPLKGAIIIWKHDGGDHGHTGIVHEPYQSWMFAIEANTTGGIDPGGEIVREGQGIYRTKRAKGKVGSMNLMGYLRPF